MANTHLAASLRVVSAHQRMKFVSIAVAKERVLEAAHALAIGEGTVEMEKLAARLEKVTGCSIAELAIYADDWA